MTFPLFEYGAFGATGALVVALVVGIAFGWALERAGLGHAPKLAGQFLLTDFTVFKVMFTAVVTAMLGAFWLGRVGVLDLSRVYVPETFLAPQLVGGLIFGVGFFVSGLCPGTSCVAAATGRIDGLAVVGGMFVGVLLTGLGFAGIAPLYNSTAWGSVTLAQWVGLPYGVMVFAVVVMAVAGFVVVERYGREATRPTLHLRHAGAALALGAVAPIAGSPYRHDHAALDASAIAQAIATEADHVTAVDLAGWIKERKPGLQVLDVTGAEGRAPLAIPGAVAIEMSELVAVAARLKPGAPTVVYSAGGAHGAQAWVLLRALGFTDVYFLQGGLDAWIAEILTPPQPTELSQYFGGEATGDVTMTPSQRVDVLRRRGC